MKPQGKFWELQEEKCALYTEQINGKHQKIDKYVIYGMNQHGF